VSSNRRLVPSSSQTDATGLTLLFLSLFLSLGPNPRVATETRDLCDVEDVRRVSRTIDA